MRSTPAAMRVVAFALVIPISLSRATAVAQSQIASDADAASGFSLWDIARDPADPDGSWSLTPRISDDDRSWVIPGIEIVTFEVLLNLYDRHFNDEDVYGSNWSTFEDNFHRGWIVDHDPFATNQLAHPYAGSIYFGFARSAGLNYWESLLYTVLGSALWELGGETGRPSINDEVSTGISGTFLGESFFRVAGWVLSDDGDGDGEPGFFHEFAAAIASPPTFVNRYAFGKRFRRPFPEEDPAVWSRLSIAGRHDYYTNDGGIGREVRKEELVGAYSIDYGMPGVPGYHYDEPFDYFHFDFDVTSSGEATVEGANARGMLVGGKFGEHDYRGLGGLFGEYSYLAPEVFRVSTTALTVGGLGQWWLSDSIALQHSLFVGAGYGAAGTLAQNEVDRDYHYGAVPQGLVGVRATFGSLAVLELQARDFYVSGTASDDRSRGHENIIDGVAALTFRIWERHCLGVQFNYDRRDAPFSTIPSRRQTIETASLVYSYVFGNTRSKMGAVEWREGQGH